MTTRRIPVTAVLVVFGAFILDVRAAETPSAKADAAQESDRVHDVYPGLASNSLTYARLSDLPSGVILKTDSLTIKDTDIAGEIAKVPPEMQAQVKKNAAFFMLENLATRQLLLSLAKAKTSQQKDALAEMGVTQ